MVTGNRRRKRLKLSSNFTDEEESQQNVDDLEPILSSDSDFEDSIKLSTNKNVNTTRSRHMAPTGITYTNTWTQKYSDVSAQTGLIASNRKAKEVENWLDAAFKGNQSRMLVLVGPPGCGKSSALRAAAKRLSSTVQNWKAPVTGQRYVSATLLEDFKAFFVGTRYQMLTFQEEDNIPTHPSSTRRVLLIEDLPISISDSLEKRESVQEVLQRAARFAPHPTVIIISGSQKGVAQSARFLIGPDLASSPYVDTIKVPPATEAMMRRRLGEVLRKECVSISHAHLEATIAACRGDIRAALNALEFCLSKHSQQRQDSKRWSGKHSISRGKRKRNFSSPERNHPSFADVNMDATLGSYHAVSKILNNKRAEDGTSKYNPEEILQQARANPSPFLAFLHHNYPEFFGDIDDVANALECLSDADSLMSWMQDDLSRNTLGECAASMVTRGFLYYNRNPIQKGWRPIRGPDSFTVCKEGREHEQNARGHFKENLTPSIFTTATMCETVPFAERITGITVQPWQALQMSREYMGSSFADSADLAMVDEEQMINEGKSQQNHIPPHITQNEEVSNAHTFFDKEMDEIEDWDD